MKPPLKQGSSAHYQTPAYVIDLLLPYLNPLWVIWEPSCGQGNLVKAFNDNPLLESLVDIDLTGVHWRIAGGESGSGFRPMKDEWAIELRDLCQGKNVGFHFKQHAAFRNGTNPLLEGKQYFEPPMVQITIQGLTQ
jgi:hypothetical protein